MFWEPIGAIVAALVGALVGGKIVSNSQIQMTEKETERQRKSIEAAFFGEINAILQLIEMRNYESIFKEAISYIMKFNDFPNYDNFLELKYDVYFLVYKNHIKNIGLMSPEVAASITRFYISMFSLLEDATTAPNSMLKAAERECQKSPNNTRRAYLFKLLFLLKNDYILLYELIQTGKTICGSLAKGLGIQYVPIFEEIESTNELRNKLEVSFKLFCVKNKIDEESIARNDE